MTSDRILMNPRASGLTKIKGKKANNSIIDMLTFDPDGVAALLSSNLGYPVTQTHGWTLNKWFVVYWSATDTLGKARADSVTTSEVAGVAYTVNANQVYFIANGLLSHTDLASINADGPGTNLAANTVYFLSAVTAGLVSATAPTTIGHVSQPVLSGKGATSANVSIKTGTVIATAQSPFYAEGTFVANFNTGIFTGTHNVTVKYVRIGKAVTLTFPATLPNETSISSTIWATSGADLPASLRPTGTLMMPCMVVSNSITENGTGRLQMSVGTLAFVRSTAWPVTTTNVTGFPDFSISYTI